MIKATTRDKETVVQILTCAFYQNRSVQYILKDRHLNSLYHLMCYSFDECYDFGEIFLSAEKNACALLLHPDKKKMSLQSLFRNISLITHSIGWRHLFKALRRESALKKIHPANPLFYLWFIGVLPERQGGGIGTHLLNQIKRYAADNNRVLCLETSTPENLPWYEKTGFHIYNTLDYGFPLYCMMIE